MKSSAIGITLVPRIFIVSGRRSRHERLLRSLIESAVQRRDANDRLKTALDILFGRRPRRDADTHRRPPLPNSSAEPAGSVGLNRLDHAPGSFIIAEGDQRLVESNVVEDFVSCGA